MIRNNDLFFRKISEVKSLIGKPPTFFNKNAIDSKIASEILNVLKELSNINLISPYNIDDDTGNREINEVIRLAHPKFKTIKNLDKARKHIYDTNLLSFCRALKL